MATGRLLCGCTSTEGIKDGKVEFGPIVNFNIRTPSGSIVPPQEVDRLASISNIHLRMGRHCNPGFVTSQLGIPAAAQKGVRRRRGMRRCRVGRFRSRFCFTPSQSMPAQHRGGCGAPSRIRRSILPLRCAYVLAISSCAKGKSGWCEKEGVEVSTGQQSPCIRSSLVQVRTWHPVKSGS